MYTTKTTQLIQLISITSWCWSLVKEIWFPFNVFFFSFFFIVHWLLWCLMQSQAAAVLGRWTWCQPLCSQALLYLHSGLWGPHSAVWASHIWPVITVVIQRNFWVPFLQNLWASQCKRFLNVLKLLKVFNSSQMWHWALCGMWPGFSEPVSNGRLLSFYFWVLSCSKPKIYNV